MAGSAGRLFFQTLLLPTLLAACAESTRITQRLRFPDDFVFATSPEAARRRWGEPSSVSVEPIVNPNRPGETDSRLVLEYTGFSARFYEFSATEQPRLVQLRVDRPTVAIDGIGEQPLSVGQSLEGWLEDLGAPSLQQESTWLFELSRESDGLPLNLSLDTRNDRIRRITISPALP